MINSIKIITAKELKRVFSDKTMVFTTFVLPLLITILMYGGIFFLAFQQAQDIVAHKSEIVINNAPASFVSYIDGKDNLDANILFTENIAVEEYSEQIKSGNIDIYIDFPANFEEAVLDSKLTEIYYYFNTAEDYSVSAKNLLNNEIFVEYRKVLLEARFGDLSKVKVFELIDNSKVGGTINEEKASGKFVSSLLPMIITISLFASAMGIVLDSVAGEKERGTLGTMLMLPIKREAIAFGKLIALSFVSILNVLSTLVGLVITFVIAMQLNSIGNNGIDTTPIMYSWVDYLTLLGIMLMMVLIFVSMLILLSALAKNIKEASNYVMPAYMVVMMLSFSTMFNDSLEPLWKYFVPILGHISALKEISLHTITLEKFGLSLLSTTIVIFCLGYFIKVIFNNEKMVFTE